MEPYYENGDYLWDTANGKLIKYPQGVYQLGTNVAIPIPLNEDVLESIGFTSNAKAEYVKGDESIQLSGDNPDGILSYKGEYVQYVSDIQQIFRKNGKELPIDENSLKAVCESLSQHQ